MKKFAGPLLWSLECLEVKGLIQPLAQNFFDFETFNYYVHV